MTGPEGGDAVRSMTVSVLDVPFRVVFGPGVLDADVERIVESWRSCAAEPASDARDVLADVGEPSGPQGPSAVRVLSRSVAQLEESLTSTLTIEAIGARRSDLLMLHACGIASDDGRVLAFVAASGTGKTTIARALGARFGYVTDETVAVTPEGRVLPYPKPLSVKPLAGSDPKAQLAPSSLGLRPVPEAPLVLAGVVLLDRRDGVDEPRFEPVGPSDAIDDLVPQTSYLSARSRPLVDLVRRLTSVGGVRRLVYTEAEAAVDLVAEAFDTVGAAAPPAWSEVVPLDVGAEPRPDESSIVRAPVDDALLLPDGEVVVFHENRLVRLAGIGPAVWRFSGEAVDPSTLLDAVLSEVGRPPEGVDAAGVLDSAILELVELGLITSRAPSPSAPDGVRP